MATKLSGVVRREVTGEDGRQYVVTLTAEGIMTREKGRRITFGPLSYGWLHLRAVTAHLEVQRRSQATQGNRRKKVSRSLI